MKKILNVITSLLLSVIIANPAPLPVFAASTDEELLKQMTWCINEPGHPYRDLSNKADSIQYRLRLGTTDPESMVTFPAVNMFFYRYNGNLKWYGLIWSFSDLNTWSNDNSTKDLRFDARSPGGNWVYFYGGSKFTVKNWQHWKKTKDEYGNDISASTRDVYYKHFSCDELFNPTNFPKNCPKIYLSINQDIEYLLDVLSASGAKAHTLGFSTSSGGRHFGNSDSTKTKELTPEQRINTLVIFDLMDVDQNAYVTTEEVNNYNTTYNTDYNFSLINGGNEFNTYNLLNYTVNNITTEEPSPLPSAGPGSTPDTGGGSSSGSGGSQQQQQQQTIENGAVSVTVNNNNQLSQDQSSWIDSTINNWNGSTEEQQQAFDVGIGSIKQFTAIARAFSGLIGAFFGFLPSWALTISGVVITLVGVMIVFRLLHLFV